MKYKYVQTLLTFAFVTLIGVAFNDHNHNNVVDEGDERIPNIEISAENIWTGQIITGTTNSIGTVRWNGQSSGLWIIRHKCFHNDYLIFDDMVVPEVRLLVSDGCMYLPVMHNNEPPSIIIDN